MKTIQRYLFIPVFVLLCGLPLASSATAQIVGINMVNSSAVIKFDDQNSFNGSNPGSLYSQISGAWTGTTWSLSQTDATTFDYANGDVAATGAGTAYNISLSNVTLTQAPLNTGYADLNFQFTVEYVLGATGLPASNPTQFSSFLVSGTVQPSAGSYAWIKGTIDYYGVNTAGTISQLDQVTYNWFYNTPGSFNNITVNGTAGTGTTPALVPFTTLTLVGNITFEVDPASLSVQTIPEPGTITLVGLGALGLIAVIRRRK
jgi:hypothetical protein